MLMEWFSMNEQVTQESSSEPVQKAKKKRSQAEKRGINRWNQVLLKRGDRKLDRILDELRWVRKRLQAQGYNDYAKPMIERFAVVDQVDLLILERVREAGDHGVFPKDAAAAVNKLGAYGITYYDVSRRIVRMNKRLHFETGELLFEKRGHRWALTSFAFDVWGDIERVC
jgi:hypothetical protein